MSSIDRGRDLPSIPRERNLPTIPAPAALATPADYPVGPTGPFMNAAFILGGLLLFAGVDQDEPGFWESLGSDNYGDPWREQRYWGD
jgi:DMSO/TMAO reductase YedYZ molybdopterin-dependent catalytic subunit